MSLVQYIREMQSTLLSSEDSANKGKTLMMYEIVEKVRNILVENDEIRRMSSQAARFKIIDTAMSVIENTIDKEYKNILFDISDKAVMYEMLIQNMFGYGVIEPYLKDQDITEIMINGYNNIFIEDKGEIYRAKNKNGDFLTFSSPEELKSIVQKIVSPINRKVDENDPIVDARLPDGSRVNIAMNPVSLDGICVTIRKFPDKPFSIEELIKFGTLTSNVAEFVKRAVAAGYNIIVSGGTGSGKTTLLNVLSSFIPFNNRVITIEDSAELKFTQVTNKVRLETRPPNIEGKGEITMRTLVRSALRMRPDRIIVGEVRGGEALDMLQAMNTGHDGSLTTGHANSCLDMLLRLETMVMMSGLNLPLAAIRQQITSALDFIIHMGKLRDGQRKVLNVAEIIGLENGEYKLNELFSFEEKSDISGIIGKVNGCLLYRNKPVTNTIKFQMAGINDYSEYLK